jgi:hypothetical protein
MRRYIRVKPLGGHLRSPGSTVPARAKVYQRCAKVFRVRYRQFLISRLSGQMPFAGHKPGSGRHSLLLRGLAAHEIAVVGEAKPHPTTVGGELKQPLDECARVAPWALSAG